MRGCGFNSINRNMLMSPLLRNSLIYRAFTSKIFTDGIPLDWT